MRNLRIAPDEYYHIFNRGVNKQAIFHEESDYLRFLFLIIYFQSPIKIDHVGRALKDFAKALGQHRVLATGYEEDVARKRMVELVSFCIMPNHFHLLIKEKDDEGISTYMQRALNAYGKYYNTKYQKTGHVFQGPYRAVHIEDDKQLLHVSAYIHRNIREMSVWRKNYLEYTWTSSQDFISHNRWGNLLTPAIVLERFKNSADYKHFLETSGTKLAEEELLYLKSF